MGKRLPTQKEIARLLNVSESTVCRALKDHYSIGEKMRIKIQQLAKKINYEPNRSAILFRQKRTFMLGVIIPSFSQDYFSEMIRGIEDVAFKKNYTVLLCQSRDDTEREKKLVEALKNQRVDGLLISIASNTKNHEHLEMLKKYGIPVVFFDRIPAMENIHYITVSLDDAMGQAVNFLIEKNHQRIGFINGPPGLNASNERMKGLIDAYREKKKKIDPQYLVSTDLSRESTHAAMNRLLLLKSPPTAIITFNDYVAMDAIQYAKQHSAQGGKDIRFVSFANAHECDYLDTPPIASIEQFPYEQGEQGTKILLNLIEGRSGEETEMQHVSLKSKLVVRV